MTWTANVWVRCSKPMDRVPQLFKVPGQWCQLLFSGSWQLSLDSLWINNEMKMEEILWPEPYEEAVKGLRWLPGEDVSWWALKQGLIHSTAAWWISLTREASRTLPERNGRKHKCPVRKSQMAFSCFLRDWLSCAIECAVSYKSFWKCTFLPKFKAGPPIIYRRQKTIRSVSTEEYILLCSAMRNYGGLWWVEYQVT